MWKKVSKANGGKVGSCSRIKNGNVRLALGEDELQRIWKDYFEDVFNIDIQIRLQATCIALIVFKEVTTS